MRLAVWRFTVRDGAAEEFERHYGPEGTWVRFFRTDPAFVRTDLYRSTSKPLEYVTVDVWRDAASYDAFRETHADEYARIDREMENLTVAEENLG